jgi:competence ComEA-like helix-hairpin-helix protein
LNFDLIPPGLKLLLLGLVNGYFNLPLGCVLLTFDFKFIRFLSVSSFIVAVMPLNLFKFQTTQQSDPSNSSAKNPQPRQSFKIDAKLWRTVLSVVFFILGAASVGWGGLNLLDHAQVPECAYLVDEQRQPTCLLEEYHVSAETEQIATDSAGLADTSVSSLNSAKEFQPLPQGLGQITVQILGAVEAPGVYQLNFSHRLGDLFKLAGGLVEDADQQYVIRNFNLAQRLKDEQRIYIPFKQERELSDLLAEYCRLGGQVSAGSVQIGTGSGTSSGTSSGTNSSSASSSPTASLVKTPAPSDPSPKIDVSAGVTEKPAAQVSPTTPIGQPTQISQEDQDFLLSQQDGEAGSDGADPQSGDQEDCISINHATSEELQTLNGVGPSTATKIIDGRPYFNINDLLNVSGIGPATLEKLEPHVCL